MNFQGLPEEQQEATEWGQRPGRAVAPHPQLDGAVAAAGGRALGSAGITGDGARISEELVFSCAVDDVDEIHVRCSSTATTRGKARTLTAARCMTSLTA
jgi:hypothetical protein